MAGRDRASSLNMAWLSLGNFAVYLPFAILVKMSSKGLFFGMNGNGIPPLAMLAIYSLALFPVMFLFITWAGWWKYATHSNVLGLNIPRPRLITFISGICGIGHIITVVLAYSLEGISIVFAALLMKGGVLALAPVVDLIVKKRRRKIYWPSLVAAGLSVTALIISFKGQTGIKMTLICLVDIFFYLVFYFSRIYIMSTWAKSECMAERKQYFVEEVMTANVGIVVILFILGLVGRQFAPDSALGIIWEGYSKLPSSGFLAIPLVIGAFSSMVGIFATLINLDRRENTFCVCVHQSSSLIAGTCATYYLALFYDQPAPGIYKIIAVAITLAAIVFLTYHRTVEKRVRASSSLLPSRQPQRSADIRCSGTD